MTKILKVIFRCQQNIFTGDWVYRNHK